MKMLGRLAWSKLCVCFGCGNIPKDPRVYVLRRRRVRFREKRAWRREEH
jgi:hypothetical protein